MREILFRGKRIDNSEWVYGFFTPSMNARSYVTTDKIYKYDASIVFVDNDQYATFAKVNEETVGQYTGLTDRHQKKIFEGDIVRYAIYPPAKFVYGVVNYKDGVFRIGDQGCALCVCAADGIEEYRLEVIGNIHDNPELLQQHKNPKEE